MSGPIESAAVLKARADYVGIEAAGIQALERCGFTSLAKWAFGSSYVPGAPDDKPFLDLLTRMHANVLPNDGQIAAFRRLHFEAHALSIADLREQVSRTDESAPRRLLAPERASRHEAQKLRLPHLILLGELEVSNSLMDEVVQMAEDEVLHYIPLESCTRRDQEVVGRKKDAALKLDASGSLRVADPGNQETADLATDWKVRVAFQRRSLSFDQANLINYEIFEKWHVLLYTFINRPSPPGYAQVSLTQALGADRELFKRMAEKTRSGIRQRQDGSRPLQEAFKDAMNDPSVMHALLPLPIQTSTKTATTSPSEHVLSTIKTMGKPKSKAKARAKGKGRGQNKTGKAVADYMSEFSSDAVAKDDAGVNICFNFNKACGCTYGEPGKRCSRGRHICNIRGCGKPHGSHQHPG